SEHELHHIKNAIVKELQKRLKNHYSKVRNQVFSIHCSENSFVGIFDQYLTWYSAERNYGNEQLSWIKLYENEPNKIKELDQATSESIFKPKKKFHLEKGLLIEWRMKEFNNKAEHRYESSEVTFRFVVDQVQKSYGITVSNYLCQNLAKKLDRHIEVNKTIEKFIKNGCLIIVKEKKQVDGVEQNQNAESSNEIQ
ncbi:13518_t:CDS:2, partial [Cetraspora pellucida]